MKSKGVNRTKSGIMLGFGEKEEEVVQTIEDLRRANVDVITIGQYLQPSKKHLPVKNFVNPEKFNFKFLLHARPIKGNKNIRKKAINK